MNGKCFVCGGMNNNINRSPNVRIHKGYVCDVCIADYIHNPVIETQSSDAVTYFKSKQKSHWLVKLFFRILSKV
ncbi:MAG: hypothetical protein UV00_C0027G0016 [candidate division WWE3 bacterium GW2011_GWF1_42_14]|uniref:Uncharacterized protein n=1 Tax=candidate division WWE3 bacterium GW2011_GWF1_42_14 TaxID=1619138 RepID=A0A0G0YHW5_UNCKA|nr:MAG: hypothetical protein UV00_C0027G0016 [candidate division WWE3 bacterium GW2011_GWF1_42_14]